MYFKYIKERYFYAWFFFSPVVANNTGEEKQLCFYYVNYHFSVLAEVQLNNSVQRTPLGRLGWLK